MRLLFIGDIFGEPGRDMVKKFVPLLRKKFELDVVIANVENAAGGNGITPQVYEELCQSGIDVMSGGNHSFDKKEGFPVYQAESNIARPANYPDGTPGFGSVLYSTTQGKKIGLINVMGRVFMDALDCPFRAADRLYKELSQKTNMIVLDIHAEASSEKVAMGWYFDGRASLVVGTHTHVQSADERILPQGTAYMTDAGLTGPYDGVIGIKKEIILDRFLTKIGRKFEPAKGDPWLCGCVVEVNEDTGKATSIERVRIELNRTETHPRV